MAQSGGFGEIDRIRGNHLTDKYDDLGEPDSPPPSEPPTTRFSDHYRLGDHELVCVGATDRSSARLGEQGERRPELHRVHFAEHLGRGTRREILKGRHALAQAMAKDRVGQVSLGFFGRADAEAIRHLAAPKTRCGNMNHIQWPRFTPRLISARAIAYVPSCASTKRCRLKGSPDTPR